LQFLFPDAKTNSSGECQSAELKESNDTDETSSQSQFKVSLWRCCSDLPSALYEWPVASYVMIELYIIIIITTSFSIPRK